MNPLHYLTELRKSLRLDGKLILTTAIDYKFWSKDNFRELDKIRLYRLLMSAGFVNCRLKKLRVPWWRMNSIKWPLGQFWYVEAGK